MSDLVLDASRSRVRIQTFAEGFLARLAHDLELSCSDLSGTASAVTSDGHTAGAAHVEAPLRGMAIAGVLGKDGRVDPGALSASEQRDALSKMHHDVFHAGPDAIVQLDVTYDGASARIRVTTPNGRSFDAEAHPDVQPTSGAVHAKGTFEVSLSALGSDVVKGPMGAFRVKDRVRVVFDVVFAARA